MLRDWAPEGADVETKKPAPGNVQIAFVPSAGPEFVSVRVQGLLAESHTDTRAVCVLAV
jgi:hypothetical protein